MKKRHRWAVDVVEESVARVDVDGQGTMHVPQWMLPRGVREGDVLAVHHEVTSDHSILRIERDVAATEVERRARASEKRRPDPDLRF